MWKWWLVLTFLVATQIQGKNAKNNCPDRAALNKVDVFVRWDVNVHRSRLISININDLDRYIIIDVTKANVSVLCDGMVRKFPRLEELTLVDVNLTQILPGAFQDLPKLKSLSLAANHLTTIKNNQFANLPHLKTLYLSSNKIDYIEEGAFDELKSLERVFLDRNRISEIQAKWFLNQPAISLIDISFNTITRVQAAAFTLPPRSVVEIRLVHNYIEVLDENAVTISQDIATDEEAPYLVLHLEKNNMRSVPYEFLESMDDLHTTVFLDSNYIECVSNEILELLKTSFVNLHIRSNPLSCDCLETLNKYNRFDSKTNFFYNTTLLCDFYNMKPPTRWL